jgi:hypothetical protein
MMPGGSSSRLFKGGSHVRSEILSPRLSGIDPKSTEVGRVLSEWEGVGGLGIDPTLVPRLRARAEAERDLVWGTTSFSDAMGYARKVAERNGGVPIVSELNPQGFEPATKHFDELVAPGHFVKRDRAEVLRSFRVGEKGASE